MDFTDKQQRFIEEYCVDFNATQSAIRAGYSKRTARSQGQRLLTKVDIRASIDKRMAKLTISANETLLRVTAHATGTMEDFLTIDEDGIKFDFAKAERLGKLGLIKKYKETINIRTDNDDNEYKTIRKEVELYPADSALDKLMRYHGLYNDKIIISWKDEIVTLLRDGAVTLEQVKLEIGDELATELFESAGISTIKN